MRLKLLCFLLPLIVNVKTEVEVSYPCAETTARPYFNGADEPCDNQNDWNAQPTQRVYNRLPIRPTPIPLLPPRPAPVEKITDLKAQPALEPASIELNSQPDLILVPRPELSDAVPSNRISLIARPILRPFPSSQIPLIPQDPKPVPQLLTDRIPTIKKPINHLYRTTCRLSRPIPRPIFVGEITTLAPIAQFITLESDNLPELTTQEPAQLEPVEHEPESKRPDPEEPDFTIPKLEQPALETASTELNSHPDLILVPKPELSDAAPPNRIRLISRPIPRPFPSSQIPLIPQDPKPVPQLLTDRIPAIKKPINHFYRTPFSPSRPIPRPIFVGDITTLAPIAQFITPEPEPTTLEPAQLEPLEHEPKQPNPEEPDFTILELEQPVPAQLNRTINWIPENRKNITYYRRPHLPSRPVPRPSLVAQRLEPNSNLQPAAEPTSKPEPKPVTTTNPPIREPPPQNILFRPIPTPAVVKLLPNPRPTEIPTSPRPPIISTKRPKAPVKPVIVENSSQTQKPGHYWLTTDLSALQDYHCEQPNIYYSIESECDSYVECKEYVPRRYVCPDGLHFDPRVPFPDYPCGYPSDVKCEGRSIKRDPQPTGQCPTQYGYFPVDDSDCSRYIMCQEGNANVMNCPAGLVFNAEHSSCDWPENVPSCKPNVFQGFTCPEPLLEDDGRVSDAIDYYRYGQSCVEYIACQRGHPRLLSCDPGLSFDEESQTCISSDYVTGCLVATPRLTQPQ